MKERITEKQLEQIVAEVEDLANRRQAELDRHQVQEILQELNLPPELLDDAMIQLHRREALAQQTRRHRWIAGTIAGVLVLGIAVTGFLIYTEQQANNSVDVYQSRITFNQDDGSDVKTVSQKFTPEINYRVTLKDVPLGDRLPLKCDWVDPQGNLAHQNKYKTQVIDSSTWETHCRYQVKSSDLPGVWGVKMFLDNRLLSKSTFVVK